MYVIALISLVLVTLFHFLPGFFLLHAVNGCEMDASTDMALVFDQGRNTYDQETRELQRRLPNVKAAARWMMAPNPASLDLEETEYELGNVAWLDGWDIHSSAGIKIHLKAKSVAPPPGQEPSTLFFSLHKFHVEKESDTSARVLFAIRPMFPGTQGDDMFWPVQTWDVHGTTGEAIAATAKQVGTILGILLIPLAVVAAGWWFLQQ